MFAFRPSRSPLGSSVFLQSVLFMCLFNTGALTWSASTFSSSGGDSSQIPPGAGYKYHSRFQAFCGRHPHIVSDLHLNLDFKCINVNPTHANTSLRRNNALMNNNWSTLPISSGSHQETQHFLQMFPDELTGFYCERMKSEAWSLKGFYQLFAALIGYNRKRQQKIENI